MATQHYNEVWPFEPQSRATESLEWRTDVIRCISTEQRESIRQKPRQEWMLKYLLDQSQYGRAKELAKRLGAATIYLPLWEDATRVGAITAGASTLPANTATGAYKATGFAIVWDDDYHYEVVTILSIGTGTITLSSPYVVAAFANAIVMPIRTVEFEQAMSADRISKDTRVSARFKATVTEDLSGETGPTYPTYRDYPVVTDRMVKVGRAEEEFEREVEVLDSVAGIIATSTTQAAPIQRATMGWTTTDEASTWLLRVWLHKMQGRWKAFWLPSWNNDVEISFDVTPSDTAIRITEIGFAALFATPCNFALIPESGEPSFVRIVGVEATSDPGHEHLTLSAPYAGTAMQAYTTRMSKLTLCRSASDRIELQHKIGGAVSVSIPAVEVPE